MRLSPDIPRGHHQIWYLLPWYWGYSLHFLAWKPIHICRCIDQWAEKSNKKTFVSKKKSWFRKKKVLFWDVLVYYYMVSYIVWRILHQKMSAKIKSTWKELLKSLLLTEIFVNKQLIITFRCIWSIADILIVKIPFEIL